MYATTYKINGQPAALSLSNMADVAISGSQTTGQVVAWNGAAWAPYTPPVFTQFLISIGAGYVLGSSSQTFVASTSLVSGNVMAVTVTGGTSPMTGLSGPPTVTGGSVTIPVQYVADPGSSASIAVLVMT
jgi:hypothetical protein